MNSSRIPRKEVVEGLSELWVTCLLYGTMERLWLQSMKISLTHKIQTKILTTARMLMSEICKPVEVTVWRSDM